MSENAAASRAVTVYQRDRDRDGGWVAHAHAPGADGEIRVTSERDAWVAARHLAAMAAELAGGDGPLVLPRAEFDAAKHVLGVLKGEGT